MAKPNIEVEDFLNANFQIDTNNFLRINEKPSEIDEEDVFSVTLVLGGMYVIPDMSLTRKMVEDAIALFGELKEKMNGVV